MSMDDVFKSLSMFQDGLQKYAVSQGINDATQAVSDANANIQDQMQRRQAHEQIARDLALKLTGVGASPQQVQQSMGAIMPTAINNPQDMYMQGQMSGNKDMQAMGQQGMKDMNQPHMDVVDAQGKNAIAVAKINASAHRDAASAGLDRKERQDWMSLTKSFDSNTKDVVEKYSNLTNAADLSKLAEAAKNPIAQNSIRTFLARAAGEKGPLSATDIEMYGGSKDLANKIERFVQTKGKGNELTDKDLLQVNQIIGSYRNTTEKQLRDKINQHAGRAVELGLAATPEDAMPRFLGGNETLRGLMKQPSGQQQEKQGSGQQGQQGPAPNAPGSLQNGWSMQMRKNNRTGLLEKVYIDPQGNMFGE